eukprot:TRINITY_DN41_c0_g2_i1.p1 TRINITY_DN41_c0_g2~~TRINITY_DN41_c0_g2_i1.p1  ORF type:complete len:292 (+),score=109.87 TRINITY_DN41_c0_g2_i1:195-1070(+)
MVFLPKRKRKYHPPSPPLLPSLFSPHSQSPSSYPSVHRAPIIGNRRLHQYEIERAQKLHKQRLKKIKPSIDNSQPKTYNHLARNAKRTQLEEERLTKIEHDNKILLEKMSAILRQKNTLDNHRSGYRVQSLRKTLRKQELQRITEENLNLLKRIQQKEPHYNHLQWKQERKQNERMLKNICEYPPSLIESKKGNKGKKDGSMEEQEEDEELDNSNSPKRGNNNNNNNGNKGKKDGSMEEQEEDEELDNSNSPKRGNNNNNNNGDKGKGKKEVEGDSEDEYEDDYDDDEFDE